MQDDGNTPPSSTHVERAMAAALLRVATLEPEPGALRSAGWQERVAVLHDLRELVVRWVGTQRETGVAVEAVVVRLKRLVHDTLSEGRRNIDIAPLRDKVVTWCAAAYFAEPAVPDEPEKQ